jgi:hypothetical protein
MFIVVVLTTEKISYAIDLINEQNSDMIFTGDINTHATEMVPWIETLKKSKDHPLENFCARQSRLWRVRYLASEGHKSKF